MNDKIKELLGLGLPNNVVASAVGVSDSYVSQLLSAEDFAKDVQELRVKNLSESAGRDKKWNSLEDTLLQKLEDLLPLGAFTKPMELIKALSVVNAAKRRAAPQELNAHAQATIVPLVLPVILAPKLTINEKGQVIEVEGRVIATMPAKVVNERLDALRGNDSNLAKEDAEKARLRLSSLQRLASLPVHELI